MRFIIIAGAGRSGSTFLPYLLSHARDIEARQYFFGGRTAMNAAFSRSTMKILSYYQPNHPMLDMTLCQLKGSSRGTIPRTSNFCRCQCSPVLCPGRRTPDTRRCPLLPTGEERSGSRAFALQRQNVQRAKEGLADFSHRSIDIGALGRLFPIRENMLVLERNGEPPSRRRGSFPTP